MLTAQEMLYAWMRWKHNESVIRNFTQRINRAKARGAVRVTIPTDLLVEILTLVKENPKP